MRIRTRKLSGALALITLVMIWPLFAAVLFYALILPLPTLPKLASLAAIGLIWVIPAAVLIRWMHRSDRERE